MTARVVARYLRLFLRRHAPLVYAVGAMTLVRAAVVVLGR